MKADECNCHCHGVFNYCDQNPPCCSKGDVTKLASPLPTSKLDWTDTYVGFLRFDNGALRLCDSETLGAFRVYRASTVKQYAREFAAEQLDKLKSLFIDYRYNGQEAVDALEREIDELRKETPNGWRDGEESAGAFMD